MTLRFFPSVQTNNMGLQTLWERNIIAKSLAEETAKRAGVLCLQAIPFGMSPNHKQSGGTIFISPWTFKEYVKRA